VFKRNHASPGKRVSLHIVKPYDFALSLRSRKSFQPSSSEEDDRLRLAARIGGIPTSIEVRQVSGKNDKLQAMSVPEADADYLSRMVEWVLFAELDLTPFYHLAEKEPKLIPVIKRLHGLKPMRPVSLFEMAVIAITEQQISLAAAYRIRSRLIERFGEPIDDLRVFPEPIALRKASLDDLRSCGLSKQKAEYVHDLATNIADGKLDLDRLKTMDDGEAREAIMDMRGFGRWSADYILVRGLARPDCVPIDDLGIRAVIGEYMGRSQRASPQEVGEKLEPFRPYRGLLAFYLLAQHRLVPKA
jgi:DNA-3-methyladenine glycosylase II